MYIWSGLDVGDVFFLIFNVLESGKMFFFFFANVIVNNSDWTQCRGTHVSFCVGGRDKGKQTAEEGLKWKKKQLLQTAVGGTQSSQSYEVLGET